MKAIDKKTETKKAVKTVKNVSIEETVEALRKSEIKRKTQEKKALNPQFSHLVSKQKKENDFLHKSNVLNVFLDCKKTVSTFKDSSLSEFENVAFIADCKKFINFCTATDKAKALKNEALFNDFLSLVKPSKIGLFGEYAIAQKIQSVVKIANKKGFEYSQAIDYIKAQIAAKK